MANSDQLLTALNKIAKGIQDSNVLLEQLGKNITIYQEKDLELSAFQCEISKKLVSQITNQGEAVRGILSTMKQIDKNKANRILSEIKQDNIIEI